jgi:hypothetical protein
MKKEISVGVYIVLALATIGLIGAGVYLIIECRELYRESVAFTKEMMTAKVPTVTAPPYTLVKDSYAQALLFFTLAAGLLIITIMLPRIQAFNIGAGGINVTLSQIQENLQSLTQQTNSLQQQSVRPIVSVQEEIRQAMPATINDAGQQERLAPQRKATGNKEKGGRKIYASKQPVGDGIKYEVIVESTDSNKPLQGLVAFHLPSYFINKEPQIAAVNGKAVLQFMAPRSFVIGATVVKEGIDLTLDLAEAT